MADIVSFKVNGNTVEIRKPGRLSLLSYLRDCLGFFGAKNGCNQGHCGSCTVIIDGMAKRACTVMVSGLDGSKVETIESLSAKDQLHPLQDAFMKEGAVQCGFCTPGMIMAAKALLDANPNPAPEDIKKALRHNICRCTGYAAIVRAVQSAAAALKGENSAAGEMTGRADFSPEDVQIGSSPLKKDARLKVTGAPVFADDLKFENMLYGKLLFSRFPSAMIKKINFKQALTQPGVVKVLTARDIPGRKTFGLLNPHQPVLAAERVRYIGEPVAVILAESEAEALNALSSIEVDYEPLPGIFSAVDGLKADAPFIHPEGNLLHHVSVRRGDTEKAFAKADLVVEGEYVTPMVEHAYLEPEAAVAMPDQDGVITIWTASQGSYAFREMIAASLNLPPEKVRVVYTPAGGAFGGKEEPTVQIHCALGAMITGRPVKMVLSRRESIIMSTKRHSAKMFYRHGATAEGKIIAMEAKVILDAGAYESLSRPVIFRAGIITAGPYDIPNVKTDSYSVYTNHPPAGAFRGFGTTQVAFGSEMQVDKLARVLGMDSFEIRKINGLAPGKRTITGQVVKNDCGYQKALAEVEQSLKAYIKELPPALPGKKIGIGVAGAYKNVGLGAGKNDQAGARIELNPQGKLLLKVGAADMGQGSDTVLAQIAASATGLNYDDFLVISNDTAQTPEGGVTTASRQTYISGHAVVGAALEFKTALNRCLDQLYNPGEEGYKPAGGGLLMKNKNGESRYVSYAEIAKAAQKAGLLPVGEFIYTAPKTYPLRERSDQEEGVPVEDYDVHFAYCYAAQAAVVAVDEATGDVKVIKIIAAQDLGKAVHYQNSCCQVEGAIVMGMGYGLSEELVIDNGVVVSDSLAKLKLTKIKDYPDSEIILVEEPSEGPYGAKGMGELPLNPTAPAIVNAIYDAVGVRICDLP
ncbi:MAG: molybdopterin cofactor-binding domain-containing protein, partial [Bacillota bacterium]|nr:molybdopterin cofactor-binding domain-containing protein [Bacillota bacterium]